ncbi:MAG: peptidase M22, partial [Clostridia bacterium]|nr:peptidase M22 [Clostridia bacterium]
MRNLLFLGIDTSNYTTSAAICDGEGNILLNAKAPLPVKEGERGLRQSDAVFHHVKNLPEVSRQAGRIMDENREKTLVSVGCSATPRDSDGSYMPCFLS